MIHIFWISKETHASPVTNGPLDSVSDKFTQNYWAKNFLLNPCCERFIISSSSWLDLQLNRYLYKFGFFFLENTQKVFLDKKSSFITIS